MAQSSSRVEKRALKAKVKQPLQLCIRICLLLGVVGWALFVGFPEEATVPAIPSEGPLASSASRSLFKADTLTPCVDPTGQEWLLIFYILGVMYMFIALAIVCDEYFVPALEVICAPDGLDLDDDIAGATFMAAGGSAPELFTSFLGTMQDSAVGFGTIVGSAVFNVLFVIAMCGFFAKELLDLSWWPLARDCTYYSISLAVLAVFFSGISPYEIEWWEAAILFVMYFGYVVLMANNAKLQERFDPAGFASAQVAPAPEEESPTPERPAADLGPTPDRSSLRTPVTDFVASPKSKVQDTDGVADSLDKGVKPIPGSPMGTGIVQGDIPKPGDLGKEEPDHTPKVRRVSYEEPKASLLRPHDFRAGMLKLLTGQASVFDAVATRMVVGFKGDVRQAFEKIDKDGEGFIERAELRQLLVDMEAEPTDEQLQQCLEKLDLDKDGRISFEEFVTWYSHSEERIQAEMNIVLDKHDKDGSGTLDIAELDDLMRDLTHHSDVDCTAVHAELDSMVKDGHLDRVEFAHWYKGSEHWAAAQEEQDESPFIVPEGTLPKLMFFIVLPLSASLYFTVPRCEDSGPHPIFGSHLRKWRWFAFVASIMWIGIYSLFMVDWATVAGEILSIPPEVMGLTFLAAGTSVPDLLSSIIVAQKGKGDMAISSSIGSNIFDILVGLPIPWLAYCAIKQRSVEVRAKSLSTDIPILLGMLVAVVGTIAICGWQLSKTLGAIMVLLYILFICQSLLNNDGFICSGGCF